MTFGERLIQLREEIGYTNRTEFAKKIGIPSTTLRNYETNVREAGHKFLILMSEFFDVSIDYLLCVTDERERKNKSNNSLENLPKDEKEILSLYKELDIEDRAEIRGTIKGMLKAEKYSTSKSKLHA